MFSSVNWHCCHGVMGKAACSVKSELRESSKAPVITVAIRLSIAETLPLLSIHSADAPALSNDSTAGGFWVFPLHDMKVDTSATMVMQSFSFP